METKAKQREIVLVFDSKRLLIHTDIEEVAHFVVSSHEAMVADDSGTHDRLMRVARAKGGFTLDTFFFDGEGSAAFLFDLIRLRIATAFIELRPDLLWIHSGVVARDGNALLIVGASGQGKSTLVTHLHELGWTFLSDEMAPIDLQNGVVLPYPRTPVRRLNPGKQMDPLEIGTLEKESLSPRRDSIANSGVRIGGVVFPRFSHGQPTSIRQLSSGDASIELMRSCTNFNDHKAEAVSALAQLASRLPCRAVTYGDGYDAANVLHRLGNQLFIRS